MKKVYVTVEATVRLLVSVHRARGEGMKGRKSDIALNVVAGSEGAELDNVVLIDKVIDAKVVR